MAPGSVPARGNRPERRGAWLLAAALVAAVALAYQPAWHGAPLWDDDAHLTRPELRSWEGLGRIWLDLGATQQYYPLLHSAFWLQHRLWGEATVGYHLVNILLHAAAALLAGLLLRRLEVPGAWLAAGIFALHPVHVESVAWITELKNTLSAVFYLGAALLYLRFDRMRGAPLYLGAAGLFVLGLLAKTVTATLPAALLVVFWWQRGRLSWRRDVLPLAPLFLLGAAAGGVTAWVERTLIGAEGAAFELGIVERFLLGGRALWFYLGTLLWPANLLFVYPRWELSRTVWWQYLYPLAALLLLAAAWRLRRLRRGPLAALLFFAGTLVPVLGPFNVYPFIYSFVADHFQYLASLGIIALAAAGAALLLGRLGLWGRPAGNALCLALLAVLAGLTWRQSRTYADGESLYRATLEGNPGSWMAHNNLGALLAERGRWEEAENHLRRALELNPAIAEAHYNLGNALVRKGLWAEAMAHYRRVLELRPGHAGAHANLGGCLSNLGRAEEAIAHFRRAAEILPGFADAHYNLGRVYAGLGRFDEAIAAFRKALASPPGTAHAYYNLGLGVALAGAGRLAEARAALRRALEIQPGNEIAQRALAKVEAAALRRQPGGGEPAR